MDAFEWKGVSMKELFSDFVKAQKAFKGAVKDSLNPHFKSKYANIESVIDSVSKALSDNNLAFVQPISSIGERWFIETILMHSSGESIKSNPVEIIIQDKSNPQKFGSSLTYFRRYSLMSFFGIPDIDDDGGNIASNNKPVVDKPVIKSDVVNEAITFKTFKFTSANSPKEFLNKGFAEIEYSELASFFEAMEFKNMNIEPYPKGVKWILGLFHQYKQSIGMV